ncbi:hypothetical protein LOS20_12725 [Enterococcus faecium]|nr:hypothetical protein [Enterococcus faecium]
MPQDDTDYNRKLNIAATETKQGYSILYMTEQPRLKCQRVKPRNPIATYLYQYGFASSQEQLMFCSHLRSTQMVTSRFRFSNYWVSTRCSRIKFSRMARRKLAYSCSGNNIEGQDPVLLAKEIVAYLEENSLPAPEQFGKITVDMNGDSESSYRSKLARTEKCLYDHSSRSFLH